MAFPRTSWLLSLAVALAIAPALRAAETERQYLSGKGKDDGVAWDFWCSAGQNAEKWSTIKVPSNWELQGFGIYTYGSERLNPFPKVQGKYKRTFTTPATWDGKSTFIVFEGAMTDTQVFINGQSAGPMHQGGYFRFKHDITKLLKPAGQENLVEVTVDDESANASINSAERRGDYWNYAGIFRPVYLEAVPQTHIDRVAIDAKADGSLNVDVVLPALPQTGAEAWLKLQVRDATGAPFGEQITQAVDKTTNHLSATLANPKLWTAETPNLYTLDIQFGAGTNEIHTVKQKFGFRTIEARPGAGLFVNGSRIILKGADRHSFWPDSGRCLSEQISKDDINLMKDMNMNAVRMSHYPPDQHFLDACDEMGMYVLDELPGWHAKYDTPTGIRLVEEMVTRDLNHPSILFWDNGNEGGWNNDLNGEYAKHDPQKRLVLHPWEEFPKGIIDTKHYPDYTLFSQRLNGNNVFFPTEFLHGLYDGGHGAGLDDYWQAMLKSKVGAGGFLWVLSDESLKRVDKGGILDGKGNAAPDGIVGPYREKEGSFYTIKQLWSPIIAANPLDRPTNRITVENRYAFTDLQDCSFAWEYRHFKSPGESGAGYQVIRSGKARANGSIAPGKSGQLELDLGSVATYPASIDALALTAKDPTGREIWTWVWPTNDSWGDQRKLADVKGDHLPAITETPDSLTATTGDLSLTFNKKTGLLAAVSRANKPISLLNGPRLVAATPAVPPGRGRAGTTTTSAPAAPGALADSTLTTFTHKTDGADLLLSATLDGPMKSITYRLRPNGWLTVDYAYALSGPHEFFGVGFDYPEANVKSMRYLGNGPSTVYQNRTAGGTLDVWDRKYNNTVVGDPNTLAAGERFDYPIFKGFYSGVRWLQLTTSEGPITTLINQDDLFVQVFTPKLPPAGQLGQTGVPFPKAGLSFLHAIPAIGSKFNGPRSTGPQGQPAIAQGDYKGSISLYFGELPQK